MRGKPTLGAVLVMAGGALAFIFSFFPWLSAGGTGVNAWSGRALPGLFPTATWVPLAGIAVCGLLAAATFSSLPERLWDFSIPSLALVAGAFMTLITLGYLVADKHGVGTGFGLVLCFLCSLAVIAGAVLDKLGVGKEVFGSTGGQPGPGWDQGWHQPGYGQQPGGPGQAVQPQAPPPPPGGPWQQPPSPPSGARQAPPPPHPGTAQPRPEAGEPQAPDQTAF